MQLAKHVTFFRAFIITYSKETKKVESPIETAQFQADVGIGLPLVERMDHLPLSQRLPPARTSPGAASMSVHRHRASRPNLQPALAKFHMKTACPFFQEGLSPLQNLIETVRLICKSNNLS